VKSVVKKTPWYISGLHFECMQCGRCCSGPSAGFIWVSKPEIELIADFLKIPAWQLRHEYLKRIGLRTTIIEQPHTRDCIFLQEADGQKRCVIYPLRPSQCRIWPFWPDNLNSPDAWCRVAQKCPGINHGRHYSFEEIEKIRKNKKIAAGCETNGQLLKRVAEIYNWLDLQISSNSELAGLCNTCGKCCNFAQPDPATEQEFDHRLFVTTPESMYLAANLGAENIKPMTTGCPYNIDGKCTIYEYRFAGCRIFYCKGDKNFQSELSESALKKLKLLCTEFQIPYRYSDLATALNGFSSN
jgi:hypothetical protein